MTTCMSAFGKANAFALVKHHASRSVGTAITIHESSNAAHTPRKVTLSTKSKIQSRSHDETLAQRDLFVDILSTNATRRDAKQFLARLKDHKTPPNASTDQQQHARVSGVNLGSLYAPARAIADSPQFVREHGAVQNNNKTEGELHIALLSLRDAQDLDDETIDGLATTIAQLVKLDMHILFVLGNGDIASGSISDAKESLARQASRLARALDQHCPHGARTIMDALIQHPSSARLNVVLPRLILDPLSQGTVVIIPSLAYSSDWRSSLATHADVTTALIELITSQDTTLANTLRLDRLILLEPLGGIPSRSRGDEAHVFINLEQEFAIIEAELQNMRSTNPDVERHLDNLRVLDNALSALPNSSSALIVTPQEAAASSGKSHDTDSIGAGTRKQKNTLIHNLLTNKPVVSSSLPTARFTSESTTDEACSARAPTATLIKKGMPLAIIPCIDSTALGWQAPIDSKTSLDLRTDPRVDLPRLVHLINNSFRRELDVEAYLERIAGRVAGLIVAGNYEGGAILTWERPSDHDGSSSRLVPYLDKFAVLQTSQGSAGVADIVFQAMVRSCFPQGVCWRSRSNNPVNRWYFERATGSWSLSDTQWTMFWTGEGVVEDRQRWNDYVDVCKGIVPTWADGKAPD